MFHQLTRPVNPTSVRTTRAIREAVDRASADPARIARLPPLRVLTVDHYNMKWAVAAIEWVRRRMIANHILDRPRNICIEVLEGSLVPRGRFQFYNGVGGALSDMIPHLIQPLRALTGLPTITALLETLRIVRLRRARYALNGSLVCAAFGDGPISSADLAAKLASDTETFGVIEMRFIGPPFTGTPVYIRTGKGFLPQSKTIVIEGRDLDGPAALICDMENRHLRMAIPELRRTPPHQDQSPEDTDKLPARTWLQTEEIELPGPLRSRTLQARADEYVEVFSALCDWEEPDPRFFPPVEDAASACDFFYRALLADRMAQPGGLHEPDVYDAYEGTDLRDWPDEAGWC